MKENLESDNYRQLNVDYIKLFFYEQLPNPWFEYLYNGIKKWDIKLKKDDWNKVEVGQNIMYNGEINGYAKICCTKIIKIERYSNFLELIKKIPLNDIYPYISLEEDAISLFHTWYKEEDENKYGIIAIKIKLVY